MLLSSSVARHASVMLTACLTACFTFALTLPTVLASTHQYDVVVYGGTSAGVISAVEAKKLGKSVVIVCPDQHLGGLSAGGLGFTDTGNKATIGGLSREFYHRVFLEYQKPETWKWQKQDEYGNRGQGTAAIDGEQRTMWIFEPHVAEKVFADFVAEFQIPVNRDRWLDRENGVEMEAQKILSITMTNGENYIGKVFIDATYEGDLMAAAGVDYHVGREANSTYNEAWNGSQVGVLHHGHHFKDPISPYKIPDDPSSGLLFGISDQKPAAYGEEDHRVQAYCYRMCLTDQPANRLPFPKPENYNRKDYQLLLRVLKSGWRDVFRKFDPIPNHKTDTNNHGPFSTDFIGENYDYPDASYDQRKRILQRHVNYQQGLMYFLANDPEVPDDVREEFNEWGLADDEFIDNGGWPHQIYVREARRMVGKYVMTEADCFRNRKTPEPIGMGSYTLDSHNVQRYVKDDGFIQNEGDIGVRINRPYQIAYGALVPRQGQCENLLVPICASSSHIAFGSIRMEPVFMILGHSAAAAAGIAIDQNIAVQEVSYEQLKAQLEREGQILDLASDLPEDLPGFVVDDSEAELTGDWQHSSSTRPYIGVGYAHDGHSHQNMTAAFKAKLPKTGRYEIRVAYSVHENRATNVSVSIESTAGLVTKSINQRKSPPIQNQWISLGKFECSQQSFVIISNTDADGHVIVDAVQWLSVEE
ncbi:Xanthan lyase precursor [Planctomycetes bacterium CA13]|uniref:Xanthan lyase n=1 Tax=Novipirellula herctigrandis TaxID=2527986 RepID=A0A5C5ZCE6_9BACT|nr:Xanthan lyase precursor [Planctomycetes bacterium CA13]